MVDTLEGKKICVSLRVFFAKQFKAQATSELLRAGSRTRLDMEKQEDLRERKHSVVYVYLKGNEKKNLECIFKETRKGGLITFSV